MVVYCSAYNCTQSYEKGISFFKFPLTNESLLKKWIIALRRDKWKPSKSSRLCVRHFTEDCFEQSGWSSKKKLKDTAVPTIFSFPKHLQKEKKERASRKRNHESVIQEIIENSPSCSSIEEDGNLADQVDLLTVEEPPAKKKREHYLGDFDCDVLENLPEKAAKCLEKSKDVIANKNKKIKGMEQQIRRLREKVKSLEDLVEHLRNSKK